jgi:hypothetical protein
MSRTRCARMNERAESTGGDYRRGVPCLVLLTLTPFSLFVGYVTQILANAFRHKYPSFAKAKVRDRDGDRGGGEEEEDRACMGWIHMPVCRRDDAAHIRD